MSSHIATTGLGWSTPDGRAVLSGLDTHFARERTGLVGRNGVGKSTLLALITGTRLPATGRVVRHGSVALLRQTVQVGADEVIADLFDARAALALLARATAGAATADELAGADWMLEARMAAALAAVRLDAAPDTRLASLSGGQRTRAAVAAAWFARADFLLLDEPTNHLDREGRETLAALLAEWRGGAIVVSHDRALLETMDAIVELTGLGAVRYGGGWSAFVAQRARGLMAAEADLARAERRVDAAAMRAQAATERQQRRDGAGKRTAARGGQPRILLGMRRERAENSGGEGARLATRRRAEAAQAAAGARARVEVLAPLTVTLPPTGLAAGRIALAFDRVTAGHDPAAPILRDLSFTVTGPERIAVTGANGSGKTTLLALAAGRMMPRAGTVSRPVAAGLLDQAAMLLDPARSIAENFARLNPGADANACRAALARFRFRADAALQSAGSLSGGQVLRAALACVTGAAPPPLLLLDEPTNHLDLEAIAAVEAGLAAYDGALIVVSHDRAFLDAIGIGRTIALGQADPVAADRQHRPASRPASRNDPRP